MVFLLRLSVISVKQNTDKKLKGLILFVVSAGFLAVLSDDKDVAASGAVAFDDVKYDNGTYNKNTGEFKIRAAGVYLIQTQVNGKI